MKAVALVPERVFVSPIKATVETRCQAHGMQVDWVQVPTPEYVRRYRDTPNVIAWNCRLPHDWMRENGRNVLYVENSLISQKSGMFADTDGFFSRSSLCTSKGWEKGQRYPVEWFTERTFKWGFGDPCDPSGPWLVALQCRDDCNMKMEFPLGDGAEDRVVRVLELLRDHLPRGRRILIRPHPRERDKFSNGGVWRDDWEMSMGGSFNSTITGCSGLVSVNSTCVSEAALLGIPIATLGTGAFTGSGISLECAHDPSRLADLPFYAADVKSRRAYAAAVLSDHFIPYDLAGDRRLPAFEKWLQRAEKSP